MNECFFVANSTIPFPLSMSKGDYYSLRMIGAYYIPHNISIIKAKSSVSEKFFENNFR
jgi:hypothetical protein